MAQQMLLQVSLKITNYKVLLLVIISLRYCEYYDKCIKILIVLLLNICFHSSTLCITMAICFTAEYIL